MSRVGKKPVIIPKGVKIAEEGNVLVIKGASSELRFTLHPLVSFERVEGEGISSFTFSPKNATTDARSQWGTARSVFENMILGVTEGFTKRLLVNGVGYKVSLAGNYLVLSLGYSHDIYYEIPEGISLAVEKQVVIIISGASKQQVGEVSATLRGLRRFNPYKGKGVYEEDKAHLLRSKEGKKK